MPPKHYDLAQYTKWHKKSPQNSKILSEEVRTSEANLYQNLKSKSPIPCSALFSNTVESTCLRAPAQYGPDVPAFECRSKWPYKTPHANCFIEYYVIMASFANETCFALVISRETLFEQKLYPASMSCRLWYCEDIVHLPHSGKMSTPCRCCLRCSTNATETRLVSWMITRWQH